MNVMWNWRLKCANYVQGTVRITRQNAQELIVAADMLQLTDLVTGCIDFFKKELDITNAVGIYR